MALFQRGRKRDVARMEAVARGWWPKVPQTFPDGSPFPAREPYEEVLAIALQTVRNGGPAWILMFCMKILAHYASLAEEPRYRLSFVGIEVPEAREYLLAEGMEAEERAISKAMLLAMDYHEMAGHTLVHNVDAQGNVLEVDDAGNLLDQHGNILQTDEMGRPIRPDH